MACKVKKAKGAAHLGLRLFWNGIRSWETTRLEDTAENRQFLEAQATIISREMKKGTFDYLKHFPDGNQAHLFRSEAPRPAAPETVRSYYDKWNPAARKPSQTAASKVREVIFQKAHSAGGRGGPRVRRYISHGACYLPSPGAPGLVESEAEGR
jgi:hypothetical protein